MDRPAITEQLQTIFRELFDDDTITVHDAMTAKDVDGWDSLNHIRLIVAVENHFQIKMTMREVGALKQVGDLITLIASKKA